jgi:hypothetical protein
MLLGSSSSFQVSVNQPSASFSGDNHRRTPARSEQVSLEVALLASESLGDTSPRVALVVASDPDVRAYVSDSLRQRAAVEVVAASSVASALDAAAQATPRVLVVAHAERAVLRHLPAVPAVLLSDDASVSDATDARRLAPLVVLRGAFRVQRLLDVAASMLAGGDGTLGK